MLQCEGYSALLGEMVPDIDEEVEGEFQDLKAHDDGDSQVQAQGASEARHQAWFLKICTHVMLYPMLIIDVRSIFLGCVIQWVSSRNLGQTFFNVSI